MFMDAKTFFIICIQLPTTYVIGASASEEKSRMCAITSRYQAPFS